MTATTTETSAPKKPHREPKPLNGVDTPALFSTINAVREQPELAEFTFRATNRWVKGTHSQTTIGSFSGAGGEHPHKSEFTYDADHPEVLVAGDNAPTPVEFLLHGLAGCLMAGVGNIAAARGIKLDEVEATIEGDINLMGLLGLSDTVRNGYSGIRVSFRIKGDASAEQLRRIVEQSRARSAVFDVITNKTPVSIDVQAA